MSAAATSSRFLREHLRAPLTVVLLVALPILFVLASDAVLGDFARALGGAVAGEAATALGAGWSAAFLAGCLGFFQVSSSRDADRRLALAGLGPLRVAAARIAAGVALAVLCAAVAFLTLLLVSGIEHPLHAALALFAFAAVYTAIGAVIGSIVTDPLEGSLAVFFIFMLDAFSGPGMSSTGGLGPLTPTKQAAELLIAAGGGQDSPVGDWVGSAALTAGALAIAFLAFWLAARART